VLINKNTDGKNNKPMLTATATFQPGKNHSIDPQAQSVIIFAVTKKGLREIERKHINTRYMFWYSSTKKAVERSVRQYFTLKRIHKKIQRSFGR